MDELEVQNLVVELDADNSGSINLEEFEVWYLGKLHWRLGAHRPIPQLSMHHDRPGAHSPTTWSVRPIQMTRRNGTAESLRWVVRWFGGQVVRWLPG